ncbi:hypothetical protein [uncultured Desulfovibrio sp.]|uniref:hypothetical protein n=1 Tax=uncultured Desulfovibrio sp. TaxID=167968 RepID=UPI0025839B36|nr:hypothetical protein [uncultured Desulfovibrio sp.]
MNPKDFRAAVVADLKAKLPPVVDVDTHSGRIDKAELERLCLASPAVRVALLGVDGLESKGGAPYAPFGLAAFVVTGTGNQGEPAEEGALSLLGAVLDVLEGNRFGCDVEKPTSVRAENLCSGDLDAGHTALWAVTWKQSVDVSNNIQVSELDDFLRCFVRENTDGPTTVEINLPGPTPDAENENA